MSSTNDVKDVKSNQTSSQKGKTYYIELYKTLESKLNGEPELAERTRHLCEAWRAINTLCQHATPTTHPHLLSWVLRHTARTVLQSEWQSPKSKDEHINLRDAIDTFIQECQSAVSKKSSSQFWESQLLQRAEWFKSILSSPWDHPVLKALLNSSGEPPSDKEVLEWLKEERSVMFVTRLRQLVASKCDDLALSLASAIMDRVRAVSPPAYDVAPKDKSTDKSKGKQSPTFVDILKTQAGFNEDLWEIVTDVEFVLLHKLDRSRCIELAKQTPLDVGYKLVERLRNRLENSPREKKLWKNAKDVATVITQMLIARCMVVPLCTGVPRATLYCCTRSLVRLVSPQRLRAETYALAALAATARHLHTFAAAVDAQVRAPTCESDMKPFVCELYIRAITAGMNELERLKIKTEKESEARSTEQTLASWFTQLGDLLSPSARMKCECTLTAFSVHPSQAMYDRIKAAPVLPPVGVDTNETNVTTSEFGSWANDSQSQTNFVKTSQTLNLKHTQKQANVLSTAILTEGEAIGLGAELCQDLAVLLSGPRLKTLTWDMNRELLLENCRTYMEKTHGGTRAVTKELKYLNLDPKAFQHLPEEEEDENDIYYGIEKGYEHLVEITQEPEEIWQDTLLDPDREVSSCSSSIDEYPIRRKQKSKKFVLSDDDSDPLRIADLKNCEKRDRTCTKERSKEPKQKTKYDRDSSQEKEKTNIRDKQEKNKQKKERKKWERSEKQKLEPTANSLSSFIGMKVIKIEDGEKKVRKKKERRRKDELNINRSTVTSITDSDYDSQGKSSLTSLNSEENESDVLVDGLFFMDELNDTEKKSGSNFRNANLSKNNELSVSNGQVVLNGVPGDKNKTDLCKTELQCNKIPLNRKDSTRKTSTSFSQTLCSSGHIQVNKDVANSIKKLLQFRRQMNSKASEKKISDYQSKKIENREKQSKQEKPINSGVEYSQSKTVQKCMKLTETSREKSDSPRNIFAHTLSTSRDITRSTATITETAKPTPRNPYLGQYVRKEVTTCPEPFIPGKKINEQLKYPMKITNKIESIPEKVTGFLNQHCGNTSIHCSKDEPCSIKSKTPSTVFTKSPQNNHIKKVYHQNSFFQTKDSLEQFHYQPQGNIKTYTKITPTSQQSYQDYFIRQLQRNLDITVTSDTATKTPVTKKKDSNPVHTQMSFASNLIQKRADIVSPLNAKIVAQQNRLDVAPNTFARLSYMHKSKQNENKEKLTNKIAESAPLNLKVEKETVLNQHITDHTIYKMQYLQRKGLAISRLEGSIHTESKDAPSFQSDLNQKSKHTLVKENPILCNILDKKSNEPENSTDSIQTTDNICNTSKYMTTVPTVKPLVLTSNVPQKNTSLSEKDQHDLILLLRQQSKLNAPVSLVNIENKTPSLTRSGSLLKSSVINNIEIMNNPAGYKNEPGRKCQQSQVKVVRNNDVQNKIIPNADIKTSDILNNSKPNNKTADILQNMSKKLEKNQNVTIKHMPHTTMCLKEPLLNNVNVKNDDVNLIHSENEEQILSKCQNNNMLAPISHSRIEAPKHVSKNSSQILSQPNIISSVTSEDSLEDDTKTLLIKNSNPNQHCAKYSNSKQQDWEKVMNAILAQKTPCRSGPSDLEIALRKDTQDKSLYNRASDSAIDVAQKERNIKRSLGKTVSDKEIKKPLNEISYVENRPVTGNMILSHEQSCTTNTKNMLEKQIGNQNMSLSVKEASKRQLNKHREDIPNRKSENNIQIISQKSQFQQRTIEKISLQNPEVTANTDINKDIVMPKSTSSSKSVPVTKKLNLGLENKDNLKLQNQTIYPKRPCSLEMFPLQSKKKQSIPEMLKESDPFISGIPNSDYDLLEELMDDDLRQEIGELSSDEETYTLQNKKNIMSSTDKISVVDNKCTVNDRCKQINRMKKVPVIETSNSQLKKNSDCSINICNRKTKNDYFEKVPNTDSDIVQNTNVNSINVNNTLLCNNKEVGVDKRSNLMESTKLFITSMPRQSSLQNVVLISPEVVYNPCSIQIQEVPVNANLFVNQNAYVAVNNTTNLTLFQTTQLTTTNVNPVIVRNTITVPMKCSNVPSSIGSDIIKLPHTKTHDKTLSTSVMAQGTREIINKSDGSKKKAETTAQVLFNQDINVRHRNDELNKTTKEQSSNVVQDKMSRESLLVLDSIKASLSNVTHKVQESFKQSGAQKRVNKPVTVDTERSKNLQKNVNNVANVRNQCINNNKLQKENPILKGAEDFVSSNKPVVEHTIDLQQDHSKIDKSETSKVNLHSKCEGSLMLSQPYSRHSICKENKYSKSINARVTLLDSKKKPIIEEYGPSQVLKSAVVTSKKISEDGIADLGDSEHSSSNLQQDNLKIEKSIPLELISSNISEHPVIFPASVTRHPISMGNICSKYSNLSMSLIDSKKNTREVVKCAEVTSKKIPEHGVVDLVNYEHSSDNLEQDNLKIENSKPLELNISNKCEEPVIPPASQTKHLISKENIFFESRNVSIPFLGSNKKLVSGEHDSSNRQVHGSVLVPSQKKSELAIVDLVDCEHSSGILEKDYLKIEKSQPLDLNTSKICEQPRISPASHTRPSISNEKNYTKYSNVKTNADEYGPSSRQISTVGTSKKIFKHGIVDLVDCEHSSRNLKQDNLQTEKSRGFELNSPNKCEHIRHSIYKKNIFSKSSNLCIPILDLNKKTISEEYDPNYRKVHKSTVVESKNISEHGIVDSVDYEHSSSNLEQENLKVKTNTPLQLNLNKFERTFDYPASHIRHPISTENVHSKSNNVNLPLLNSNKKTIISEDALRLQKKRLYIMNRDINTPSLYPPIQLSYMPLEKKSQQTMANVREKSINYNEDDTKMDAICHAATHTTGSSSSTEDEHNCSDLTKYNSTKLELLTENKERLAVNEERNLDMQNDIAQNEQNSVRSLKERDFHVPADKKTSFTESNTPNMCVTIDDHKNKNSSLKSVTDASLNCMLIMDGEIFSEVKENKQKEDNLECAPERRFQKQANTLINEKTSTDAKLVDLKHKSNNKEEEFVENKPEVRRIFLRSASRGAHKNVEKSKKNEDSQENKDGVSIMTDLDTKSDNSERRTSKRILKKKIHKSGNDATIECSSLNINKKFKEIGVQNTFDCSNKVSTSDTCLIDIEDEIQSSKILKSLQSIEVEQQTNVTETVVQSKHTQTPFTKKDISGVKTKSKSKLKNKQILVKKTNNSFKSSETESSKLSAGETKQFSDTKQVNDYSGLNKKENRSKPLDVEHEDQKPKASEIGDKNLEEICCSEITVDKPYLHDEISRTTVNKLSKNESNVTSMVKSNEIPNTASYTNKIQARSIVEDVSIKEKEHKIVDEPVLKKVPESKHIPKDDQTGVTRNDVRDISTFSIDKSKLNQDIVKKLTIDKSFMSCETIFCEDNIDNSTMTKLSECDSVSEKADSGSKGINQGINKNIVGLCTNEVIPEKLESNHKSKKNPIMVMTAISEFTSSEAESSNLSIDKSCQLKCIGESKETVNDDNGLNDNEKRKVLNVKHMDKTNACEESVGSNEMGEYKRSVNHDRNLDKYHYKLSPAESEEILFSVTDEKPNCTSIMCKKSRKRTSARNILKKSSTKEKEDKVSDNSVIRKGKPIDNKVVIASSQEVNNSSEVTVTSRLSKNNTKLETKIVKNTNEIFKNSEIFFCKDNVFKNLSPTKFNDHGSKDNDNKSDETLNVGDIDKKVNVIESVNKKLKTNCTYEVATGKLDPKVVGSVHKTFDNMNANESVGTDKTSVVTSDQNLNCLSVHHTKSKKRPRNVKKKSLTVKQHKIGNEPDLIKAEVSSYVYEENQNANVRATENLSLSATAIKSTKYIEKTGPKLGSNCDITKENMSEVIDLVDDEVLPKEKNTVIPKNPTCRIITKEAKHKTRHKTGTDVLKCDLSNVSDIKNIRDSIKIQELPTQVADPLKRIILIKLPDGKTFKASVFGKLDINFDTLFADPQMKSLLLNSIKGRKRYTLNIKQTSLHSNANESNESVIEETQLPQPQSIDTVDLISDDEDEPTKSSNIGLGSYNTTSTNSDAFTRNKLGRKCSDIIEKERISITSRCEEGASKNLQNIESLTQTVDYLASSDNKSHNGDNIVSLTEKHKEQLEKTITNCNDAIVPELNNEVRVFLSSSTSKLKVREEPSEIMTAPSVLDLKLLKTNKSELVFNALPFTSESTAHRDTELTASTLLFASDFKLKINKESVSSISSAKIETNDSLITSSISENDKISTNDPKVQSLDTVLRMSTQTDSEIIEIDDSSNDSVRFGNTVDNLPDKKICELKNLLLQELGIDELKQNLKEGAKEIKKEQKREKICSDAQVIKDCFVQLFRCDGLLRKICDEITVNPDDNNSTKNELSQPNLADVKSLSRSGSFSILNDFTLYDDIPLLPQTNQLDMITFVNPSVATDLCDFTGVNNTNEYFDSQLVKPTICNAKSISETPAYGRTSPLMEILDKIVHLRKQSAFSNNILNRNRFPSDKSKCDSEWRLTKESLHFQDTVSLHCFEQLPTDINESPCLINEYGEIKKYNVPRLVSMMTDYFANGSIIDQLNTFRRTSNSLQIKSYKRKWSSTGMVISNKILKTDDCHSTKSNNNKLRVGCKKKINFRSLKCNSENSNFDKKVCESQKMETAHILKPRDNLTVGGIIVVSTKYDQDCCRSKSEIGQNITLKVCDELSKSLGKEKTDDSKQDPSKEIYFINSCNNKVSQTTNPFKNTELKMNSSSGISEVSEGVFATFQAVAFDNNLVSINDTSVLNENSEKILDLNSATMKAENIQTISVSNYKGRKTDKVLLKNVISPDECSRNVQSNVLHDQHGVIQISTYKVISSDNILISNTDEPTDYIKCTNCESENNPAICEQYKITNFDSVNNSEMCEQYKVKDKIVLSNQQRIILQENTLSVTRESNLYQSVDLLLSNKISSLEANLSTENDQEKQCLKLDTVPNNNCLDSDHGSDKKTSTKTCAIVDNQSSDYLESENRLVNEDLGDTNETIRTSNKNLNKTLKVSKIKESTLPNDKFIKYNELLCNDRERDLNNYNKPVVLKKDVVHRVEMNPKQDLSSREFKNSLKKPTMKNLDTVNDIIHNTSLTNFQERCTVIKEITEQTKIDDVRLGVEMAATSIENVKEKSSSLIYKYDKNVILKGVEYEDPVVGTCYVFPVIVSSDNSNSQKKLNNTDNMSVETTMKITGENEDINTSSDLYEFNDFIITPPKATYSRGSLKRKIDMKQIRGGEKKYRKGKNIDYPKFTAVAISESAYSKEYKRLLDYCSSIKFSYSRSFLKEFINVPEILTKWPIDGNPANESPSEIDSNLFNDLDVKENYISSDSKRLTLSEEISSSYKESDKESTEAYENISINMGFGEGSDRAIQNLEKVKDETKFSAATLSDVKPQPFLVSENVNSCTDNITKETNKDQTEKIRRYLAYIKLRDKVRSFFKKTRVELSYDWIKGQSEDEVKTNKSDVKYWTKSFPFELCKPDFIEISPIEAIVQVVQVGQLPVSASAQNPVTCDPRVTQVSDVSPQFSADNSPQDESQTIKTEYTVLTTADLTLPLVHEYSQQNQTIIDNQGLRNTNDPVIPIESEIKPGIPGDIEQLTVESKNLPSLAHVQTKNIHYHFDRNNLNSLESSADIERLNENNGDTPNLSQQKKHNGSKGKTDQIAHAMNAAGITTSPENLPNSRSHALVNILTQKIRHGVVNSGQNPSVNYPKVTSINAMALQQALAQILPPPLNDTNSTENNQQVQNASVTPQVLHIVQGKTNSGNQITLVDNSQPTVISAPNTAQVLHIVQNKSTVPTSNGPSISQTNSFSGISLVDTGLQQGGNQLLHIVNAGNQKNNSPGHLLKRVNLLTNLTNVQGSNEQKMVQFVCKPADGKAIQLSAAHQRSMVLRLQPIDSNNLTSSKSVESEDLSPSPIANSTIKESSCAQQEIKSRSMYEENYAKFIQNSSNKSILEKSTSLPKFNQVFGKPVFQEDNQKQNDINTNDEHLSPTNSANTENAECQPSENSVNMEHISHINSPPLLLRKSPASSSQSQSNLVQQIKQSIAPMNIQTMHGGVIYTRQIPVNIGGGQTINLITVPSTELIEDSSQKQSEVKFVNQNDIEPSIIKIVPQSTPNTEVSSEEGANQVTSNENTQTSSPQPVLTQMRIKLPMISKTPQMVPGARVIRPSFFQIQRNVIGGVNQPVYQQLVLTAAPPLGQQTIRIPHTQTNRIKVSTDNQSENQMSSSTLEQLREFDMVLEQVKERSTVQPTLHSNSAFNKIQVASTDCSDGPVPMNAVSAEPPQQVLYSIGNNNSLNVAYVNRKTAVTTPVTSSFVRSPDSTGMADSPTSSTHVQIHHTISPDSQNEISLAKSIKVGSKSKSRPKSSTNPPNSLKINTVPPKTSTQKPLEDEQTTQRILYILAEYKEQVENSPDKDKPAPRRRSNPPSNPSGSSKRKKSSSSSKRPNTRDLSPVHGEDTCRTMGSEDSSCGTSQGECAENCLDTHSPQDSPRKVARKLTFENETQAISQPRPQPQRNVIVADGQTITVARSTAGKPATAVLMPANYILPVSMVKGGQQIAIVTNRGPKILTVGGSEGGAANTLLLQRLIGPAGLKPILTRPGVGVRHVRLPTTALHNLQTINLTTSAPAQPPDSTASPGPAATPDPVEARPVSSPWPEQEQDAKHDRSSSPEGSEPWNLQSSVEQRDYSYDEPQTENVDRTVLVVHKKEGTSRQHRLTHVSAAALRHKYAILEHELRLQKSLSEECEDLGVDSPSASELFPEAELLFAASPAHDHAHDQTNHSHSHTPQPTLLSQNGIPQPDIDDQIATDHLIRQTSPENREDLNVNLGLEDVGIVTVSRDGMQATLTLDHEEFARSHPNTTFHSEPTEGEVQPFTIAGLKGRSIGSTIFHHANSAPATVLMTAPQTTVISQAAPETSGIHNTVKYADINNIINNLPNSHGNDINLSSVLVKDDGLTRYDNILTDSRELHLSNTASAIVHSLGNATQVIRRVCYEDDKRVKDSRFLIGEPEKRDSDTRFIMDEPDAIIAGNDAKMVVEDSSREATLESMPEDDDRSSPERHAELFWESNSASEKSESRRPLDYSSDSDKCCKSPSFDETNSTDSSGVGSHMRLDSVIKEARGRGRSGSGDGSSADDTHPPLRTYPPKRMFLPMDSEMGRSTSGKTRAGEGSPDDSIEVRRRASGRGVVKRGCHCCNGSPVPPRPKKPRQRKPTMDFSSNN